MTFGLMIIRIAKNMKHFHFRLSKISFSGNIFLPDACSVYILLTQKNPNNEFKKDNSFIHYSISKFWQIKNILPIQLSVWFKTESWYRIFSRIVLEIKIINYNILIHWIKLQAKYWSGWEKIEECENKKLTDITIGNTIFPV